MKLRPLEPRDAEYMLEWMHDPKVNRFFQFDAEKMTLEDTQRYIEESAKAAKAKEHFHFAISDDNGEYLGTISLKNVDWNDLSAEYAVSLRSCCHGKGIGTQATFELLEFAFKELKLERVYLNVLADNQVAKRVYEKSGFKSFEHDKKFVIAKGVKKDLIWYQIFKNDFLGEDLSGKDFTK